MAPASDEMLPSRDVNGTDISRPTDRTRGVG